jgi:hypothetical protein
MNTVLEWYRNGGPVMNAILLVAVVGLAVFLERFYTIVICAAAAATSRICRTWPTLRRSPSFPA